MFFSFCGRFGGQLPVVDNHAIITANVNDMFAKKETNNGVTECSLFVGGLLYRVSTKTYHAFCEKVGISEGTQVCV